MIGKTLSISDEQIAQLNATGVDWKVNNIGTRQHNVKSLGTFQRLHGHCRVPKCLMVDSVKLGEWVASDDFTRTS